MRALIADDDTENREILSRMLIRLGWTCDAEGDGEAALVRLRDGDYDAALLDLSMPGVDGFEAARRLRASGSRLVLLAVSGAEEEERALEAGFDGFLSKPYSMQELREVLKGAAGAGHS